MKIDGRVTVLIGSDGMTIELFDYDANVRFAQFELNGEQTLSALGRLAHCEVDSAEVFGLENVGSKREHQRIEVCVGMENGVGTLLSETRRAVARERIEKEMPEGGWQLHDNLLSQDSFFWKDNALWCRARIVRWLPRKGAEPKGDDRIKAALDIIEEYGGYDGGHHKMWVLDQAVRALTGDGYEEWVKEYMAGEDGPETYSWDIGIAP